MAGRQPRLFFDHCPKMTFFTPQLIGLVSESLSDIDLNDIVAEQLDPSCKTDRVTDFET